MLLGNAPNPFNPKTEIRFRLAGDGPVTLRVYDLAGRLVRTLVDGPVEAGLHAVAWDGRDHTGREQPSGAYFYRLSGRSTDQTGKMMLVR
jgi:flagellar hook assembly protein FlgD